MTIILSAAQKLPTTTAVPLSTEGRLSWNSTRNLLQVYDAVRARGLGAIGLVPYAYQLGGSPEMAVTTAVALAANGGSIAIPILVQGHMLLDHLIFWNTDTSLARTAEWRLFYDPADASNSLNEVTGANGTYSFTPSLAGNQSSSPAGAPIYLAPGLYWLVLRNTNASRTLGLGSVVAGTFALSTAQTKTLASGLTTTLDFVAVTWVKVTALYGVVLSGRVANAGAGGFT